MANKKPNGRPTKEFDKGVFESLCGIMCTEVEICEVLNTTDKTLSNWCKRAYGEGFSEVYKKLTARGRMSLRRNQFNLSKKSPAMAIFLGKQYLGQTDAVQVDNTEALNKLDEVLKEIKGIE